MDLSGSQCSSSGGCESGWTMYLNDQSSRSNKNHHNHQHQYETRGEEDDKGHEDLSMVSDASSGRRHYIVDDDEGGGGRGEGELGDNWCGHQVTKNKKKVNGCCYNNIAQNCCYLDDTASSPAFNYNSGRNGGTNNQVQGMSQDFNSKKTKGKSSVKKHFGFLQQSFPEKSASKESGGFQGRKWK